MIDSPRIATAENLLAIENTEKVLHYVRLKRALGIALGGAALNNWADIAIELNLLHPVSKKVGVPVVDDAGIISFSTKFVAPTFMISYPEEPIEMDVCRAGLMTFARNPRSLETNHSIQYPTMQLITDLTGYPTSGLIGYSVMSVRPPKKSKDE